MYAIKNYFFRLCKIWITRVFLFLDAIGLVLFMIQFYQPTLTLPFWILWAFVGISVAGFVGANIKQLRFISVQAVV